MFMIYLRDMFQLYFVVTLLSLLYVMSYDIYVYAHLSYRLIVIMFLSNVCSFFVRVKTPHHSVFRSSFGLVLVCLYHTFFYPSNYHDDLQY